MILTKNHRSLMDVCLIIRPLKIPWKFSIFVEIPSSTPFLFAPRVFSIKKLTALRAQMSDGHMQESCRIPARSCAAVSQLFVAKGVILLMEEILHWRRLVVYQIIYEALYIPGGAVFRWSFQNLKVY